MSDYIIQKSYNKGNSIIKGNFLIYNQQPLNCVNGTDSDSLVKKNIEYISEGIYENSLSLPPSPPQPPTPSPPQPPTPSIPQFKKSYVNDSASWSIQQALGWLMSIGYYPDLVSGGTNTYYEEIIDQWNPSTNSYSIRISHVGSCTVNTAWTNVSWVGQPPSPIVRDLAGTIDCNSSIVNGSWLGTNIAFGSTEEIYTPCYNNLFLMEGDPASLNTTPTITYY